MNSIPFDTLAFSEELSAADVPEQQTRVLSKVLESKELATRGDLEIAKREIQLEIETVRKEIAETRADIIKWVVATSGIVIAAIKLIP